MNDADISNLQAEHGLVSCILQGAESRDLSPEWFTDGHLWPMLEAVRECGASSPVEIAAYLRDQKALESVGGPAKLMEIWRYAPSPAQYDYYFGLARNAMLIRRLRRFGHETSKRALEATDGDALASLVEAEALSIRGEMDAACDDIPSFRDASINVISMLEQRVKARQSGKLPGIPSGLNDLDMATNGFQGGRLYIIGARPGMGKTSLLRQIMLSAVQTTPVYFVSLEMSIEQTIEALIATEGRVDFGRMQAGTMNDRDFNRTNLSLARLVQKQMFIDDRFLTAPQMESYTRRMVRTRKIGMLMLDYLQLIPASNDAEQRNPIQRIGNASNTLIRIAKTHNIPVIAVVQIKRESADEADKLSMADIRECGQIEQDAGFIGLIGKAPSGESDEPRKVNAMGQPIVNDNAPEQQTLMMKVVKNRWGSPDHSRIKLIFQGEHLRFASASNREE